MTWTINATAPDREEALQRFHNALADNTQLNAQQKERIGDAAAHLVGGFVDNDKHVANLTASGHANSDGTGHVSVNVFVTQRPQPEILPVSQANTNEA